MERRLRIEQYRQLATDIWSAKVVEGFPAPNMNLCLVPKVKAADNYGGFGIYSISYTVFVKQDVRYFMQQTLNFPMFQHQPLADLATPL